MNPTEYEVDVVEDRVLLGVGPVDGSGEEGRRGLEKVSSREDVDELREGGSVPVPQEEASNRDERDVDDSSDHLRRKEKRGERASQDAAVNEDERVCEDLTSDPPFEAPAMRRKMQPRRLKRRVATRASQILR